MSHLEFSLIPNSTAQLRLLCLSNGHGEDIVAVRILQELLHSYPNQLDIAALPLVGEGQAYRKLNIPVIGAVQTMPSGGFIYMDGKQLVRDLQGGLVQLTLNQIKTVRSWAKGGGILAVGDIVPLLFAWLSGAKYAFVGTAKSEYYLRDEVGSLPRRSLFNRCEGWSGSVYLPWERWLMSHPRCQAVFPRDSLTTQILQKWAIPAFDLGNPMMDRLEASKLIYHSQVEPALTLTLLPGSRAPEAYTNWQQILIAVITLCEMFADRSLVFLSAIAPSLSLEPLCQGLINVGFQQVSCEDSPFLDVLTFKHKNAYLVLTQNAYNECLQSGELAIAMAGTATEQFVGLGKPAITFPGRGPQFTDNFAEAQSRLLGSSVVLLKQPTQVADVIQSLLNDHNRLQLIAANGVRRMGKPGAARRIAACLMARLLEELEITTNSDRRSI